MHANCDRTLCLGISMLLPTECVQLPSLCPTLHKRCRMLSLLQASPPLATPRSDKREANLINSSHFHFDCIHGSDEVLHRLCNKTRCASSSSLAAQGHNRLVSSGQQGKLVHTSHGNSIFTKVLTKLSSLADTRTSSKGGTWVCHAQLWQACQNTPAAA